MYIPDLTIYRDEHEDEQEEQFFISLNSHDRSHLCEPSTTTITIENTDIDGKVNRSHIP